MAAFAGAGLSLGILFVNITAKADDAISGLKKFADQAEKQIENVSDTFKSLKKADEGLAFKAFDKLKDQANKAADSIKQFSNTFAKEMDKAEDSIKNLEKTGEGLSKIGGAMSVGITAPLAGIAAAAISAEASFGAAMSKIQAVTDATGAEMEVMRQQALQLGKDTKFSAQEAAEGMGELGAAGF